MNLYDPQGQRKHLTSAERDAFLKASDHAEREVRTFCHTLAYTGRRISEVLALTANRIDLKDGTVVFDDFKKGRASIFRPVPILVRCSTRSTRCMTSRLAQKQREGGRDVRLWGLARNTACRHLCAVMRSAKIKGTHATLKGLRHGSGI